jgi:predicted NAD-dependent protein-ADP-ribosyltransferase YbiA (DUF1768 family)
MGIIVRSLFLGVMVLSASSCVTAQVDPGSHPDGRDPRYPAQWWAEVPRDQAASWEIPPQDAGPGEVILSKRNELGILSNFAATPFTYRDVRYASVEGFWQMMKYPEGADDPRARFSGLTWSFTRADVSAMVGFQAKDAGTLASANMKKMGINWVSFEGRQMTYRTSERGDHYQLIVTAMREKLRQNPEVRRILVATGDLKLRPDHKEEPGAGAAWRYFDIWMELREELLAE